MRLCKHEYDISRSLCPRCSIEAKEAGIERRIAEASKTGQATGAAVEREQIVAMIEVAAKNTALAVAVSDGGEAAEFGVSCVLGALEGLVEEIRAGSHRPDTDPLKARTVEPRDTEPPRREAVVGKPSAWEEAEAGEDEPEDIWTDEEHWRAMSQEGRSEILYQVRKEGTPAPEPRPSTEWLEANVPHALLRALLVHAESTILRDHESMADPDVYESACPFCGAASNASTRELHDEECVGEQARAWLVSNPQAEKTPDLRPLYRLAEGWREFAEPGEFAMHHAADALVTRLDMMVKEGTPGSTEP